MLKENDEEDSEGFVDSPILSPLLQSNEKNSSSSSLSLYDIVVINKRKESFNLTILSVSIVLLIIILTPILLSLKQKDERFWRFSMSQSLLDVWLLSSLFAILTLFTNYIITLILFACYGCYIITKSIFFEKYKTQNIICFVEMITLTLILFLISLLEKRSITKLKKRNSTTSATAGYDNPWELRDKRDDLTERLLNEHSIDEKSEEVTLHVQDTINPPDIIDINAEAKEILPSPKAGMKLFGWAKTEWQLITFAFISLIIASFCSLSQPFFLGKIISASTTTSGIKKIWRLSIILLIIFIVGGIATFIRSWFFNLVGERLVRKIRVDLFTSIMQQDIIFFDSNKTGFYQYHHMYYYYYCYYYYHQRRVDESYIFGYHRYSIVIGS